MTLQFKGNKYDVNKLAKKAGPIITVKADELHEENDTLVEIKEGQSDLVVALFAKYEGKYVLLTGRGAFAGPLKEGLPITGKLLSNPVLKTALA